MRAVKASKWKCDISPALATKTSSIPPFSPSSDFEPSSGHDTEELHAFLDTGTNLSPSKKTHIKDIEDEDNVAGLLEHYIEDFPWPASDLIAEHGKLPPFFELFWCQKVENNEAMWAPFSSRDKWELARWLMCSSISQKEIDTFLKLESVCTFDCFSLKQNLKWFLDQNNVNLSFSNKRKLFQTIDKLPTGPEWTCEAFEIHEDLLDDEGKLWTEEIKLWKCDMVACIWELMSDAQFKEHMHYTSE